MKSAHFPVRTSASEAISSPTRCGSSSVPAAAALSSSNRFDEPERLRVEERELLLDRDREVGARLERRAGRGELLLGGKALFLAHGR